MLLHQMLGEILMAVEPRPTRGKRSAKLAHAPRCRSRRRARALSSTEAQILDLAGGGAPIEDELEYEFDRLAEDVTSRASERRSVRVSVRRRGRAPDAPTAAVSARISSLLDSRAGF